MSIVLWWLVSLAGRSWCQATQLALFGLSAAEILEVRGAAGNWRGRLMWGEAAAGTGAHTEETKERELWWGGPF